VPVAYYILAPFDHKKNRYLNELVQASPGS
jgi:hypothetical protein